MDSFEQVAKLDTPALRDLLERGRPEQRVWAIWALAMRTGGIASLPATDRDAGVRRTLAVLLAGHGELDTLIVLARQDPARSVRESAMQLVTRIAAQGAIDAQVVLEAAREDPSVRSSIFAAIDRGAPAFLVELASEYMRSGAPNEQGDAFEALLRSEAAGAAAAARAWLAALAETQARDACSRLARMLGDYAFACELANAPKELRLIALGVLHAPSWEAIEQLVGDDVDVLLHMLRDARIEIPITALARAALDGQAGPLVERLAADLSVIDAPSDELRPLLPLLDKHYSDWITALERRDDADPERARARGRARRHLVNVREQIRRLLR